MAKVKERPAELMIIAQKESDIYQRWQGWPDLFTAADLAADRLQVPVLQQLPLATWRSAVCGLASPNLPDLRLGLAQVQAAWQRRAIGPWAGVAHSLIVHWLLFAVGGYTLLNQLGSPVGAVLVEPAGDEGVIWPGFCRANPDFGVSCLLGERYGQMADLRQLLQTADVDKSLATLQPPGRLLVKTTAASRILHRVSALNAGRGQDGSWQITWPSLAVADLEALSGELTHLAGGLALLQRQAVLPVLATAMRELPEFQPADLGLALQMLLVQVLVLNWLSAGLLPQPVAPLLAGLL